MGLALILYDDILITVFSFKPRKYISATSRFKCVSAKALVAKFDLGSNRIKL
jgi:hypothetical protein